MRRASCVPPFYVVNEGLPVKRREEKSDDLSEKRERRFFPSSLLAQKYSKTQYFLTLFAIINMRKLLQIEWRWFQHDWLPRNRMAE